MTQAQVVIRLSEDAAREFRIEQLRRELCSCGHERYPVLWNEFVAEIEGRSAEQVWRMEQERGLA